MSPAENHGVTVVLYQARQCRELLETESYWDATIIVCCDIGVGSTADFLPFTGWLPDLDVDDCGLEHEAHDRIGGPGRLAQAGMPIDHFPTARKRPARQLGFGHGNFLIPFWPTACHALNHPTSKTAFGLPIAKA